MGSLSDSIEEQVNERDTFSINQSKVLTSQRLLEFDHELQWMSRAMTSCRGSQRRRLTAVPDRVQTHRNS